MNQKQNIDYIYIMTKNSTSFKPGNKAAEKWTLETVTPIIEKMIEQALNNKQIYYIGTLLINQNLYEDIWADWKKKFNGDNPVSRLIKKTESILRQRLVSDCLISVHGREKVNTAMAIWMTKAHYGWAEPARKHDVNLGGNLNVTVKSDKQKKELEDNL